MSDEKVIEKICPDCIHFYEHGKTEWEDAKECGVGCEEAEEKKK